MRDRNDGCAFLSQPHFSFQHHRRPTCRGLFTKITLFVTYRSDFKMKKIATLFVYSCIALSTYAQANSDSLYKVWSDISRPDSVRLSAVDELAWTTRYKNPDSAIAYATLELTLAKGINHKFWQAKACNTLGVAWYIKSDYPKAIEWHQQSLAFMKEMRETGGMATSYNNLGNIYSDQGDFVKALQHYQRALDLVETTNKPKASIYYGNIGAIYLAQGVHPKALEQFQKSLAICEELNDEEGMAVAYNNIGIIYYEGGDATQALAYYGKSVELNKKLEDKQGLAETYLNIGIIKKTQGDYAQALEYGQKSLAMQQELSNAQGIAEVYGVIGEIYAAKNDMTRALANFNKELSLAEEIGNKDRVALSYIHIGNVYLQQKKHPLAASFGQKAFTLAGELGIITAQRDASNLLYQVYKSTGRNTEALTYHEKVLALTDSIEAAETNKKLAQMEFAKILTADSIKIEEEKQQVSKVHRAEVSQKDDQRNMAIYIGAGVLALAGALGIRLRYVRRARAAIHKEKIRSDNLLLNILPADIAEELKTKGKAEAREFDGVSILFTDFKGFTGLSETMSAKELVAEINHCFEKFDGIVSKYGIEKIKTIGDSYMAAGGLPVSSHESAKNTVLAALEMQTFIEAHKTQRAAEQKPVFRMRAGIHTGSIAAGIVGVKKLHYDIWGDAVNTASRVESSGEAGRVNISEATYELIKNEPMFEFQCRGKVQAKGKGEMGMYFVSLGGQQ